MTTARTIQRVPYEGRKHSGGEVATVVSGKGGVGKTNLALNLGIRLAQRGRRVVLLDADFGLANADVLMNVSPPADLANLLDPRQPVDDLLVEGPCGLRVLCGASGFARHGAPRAFGPRDCELAVRRLRAACDLLLIDCAAGIDERVVSFALSSDLLVAVTTPEPPALADCYATLKLLRSRGFASRAGLVVNMARSQQEATRVTRRLQHVARQFLGLTVEHRGHVPLDTHVPRAVCDRVPLLVRYPHCAATSCIDRVSAHLAPAARLAQPATSVWSRVAGLFL